MRSAGRHNYSTNQVNLSKHEGHNRIAPACPKGMPLVPVRQGLRISCCGIAACGFRINLGALRRNLSQRDSFGERSGYCANTIHLFTRFAFVPELAKLVRTKRADIVSWELVKTSFHEGTCKMSFHEGTCKTCPTEWADVVSKGNL